MKVVERASRENGTEQKGLKRQKIVKGLVAETALAAKRHGGARGPEEAGQPEEAEKPGGVRGTKKSVLAAREPEEVGELEETKPAIRGLEEVRGAEEAKPVTRGPKEAGGPEEAKPAAGGPEEPRGSVELVTAMSLSWSDC